MLKIPTKSNNICGRGGARPGAGRKKTAVKEKAENGNPGGRRLEVLDIPEVEGVEMPLAIRQKTCIMGTDLHNIMTVSL